VTSESSTEIDPPPQDAKATTAQQGRPPQQLSTPTAGIAKSDLPPSPHSHQITCKTEKDWRDRIKFWAELAGLLFLILYTLETRRTNNLTQCALNISKQQFAESQRVSKEQFGAAQDASARQFQLDQRPWIGMYFNIQDFEKGKTRQALGAWMLAILPRIWRALGDVGQLCGLQRSRPRKTL